MLESEAYKTYHVYATGEKIPKPKYVKNKADPESSPKKKSAQASKGKTSTKVAKIAKKKQPATTSHASISDADKGTNVIPGVLDVPTYNSDDEQISWKSSNEEDDDEVSMSKNDDDNDDDYQNDLSTFDEKERQDEEDKEEEWSDDEAYDEVSSRMRTLSYEGRDTDMEMLDVQATQVIEDTHLIITAVTPEVQQQSSSVSSSIIPNMLNPKSKKIVQLQSDRLREEAQADNEDFINKIDENIKKIIKEQVKVQVKDQVSKILPKIEKLVNDQLEAEVLTRSSNKAKTSHAIAANLSELELKKIS
ncbi:hypothetical protein Tco_0839210 [Tanacetum coccineum]|uniref:Uncharacterized protein n=1 Tax=Tanacetum coccineum TaxID=301880 RepID=A0ABQ5AQV2_9ASTR